MKYIKDFSGFRAEKLTYVIFSRFDELLIQEQNIPQSSFDYIIDVTDKGHQTGRIFGVEVEATDKENTNDITKSLDLDKYKNIKLPLILVFVNTKNDKSFYTWLLKPANEGKLMKTDEKKLELSELNNENVKSIISNITSWYSDR